LSNGTQKDFAFLFSNGEFQTIGIPGQSYNVATKINARGDISGGFYSLQYVDANPPVFTGIESAAWVIRR
jgi:uncharacterized membrane protein